MCKNFFIYLYYLVTDDYYVLLQCKLIFHVVLYLEINLVQEAMREIKGMLVLF